MSERKREVGISNTTLGHHQVGARVSVRIKKMPTATFEGVLQIRKGDRWLVNVRARDEGYINALHLPRAV